MNRALLHAGLAAVAAQLPPQDRGADAWSALEEDLVRYLAELALWNPKLGLVEASPDEMVTKHVIDCLAALPVLLPELDRLAASRLADIGSGAGLPGMVLALALRRLRPGPFSLCLVEKQQRRVGFLLNVQALLGLKHLDVCQESLEQVGQRAPGAFDIVTARAFRPLEPGILADLRRLLCPGGCLFLYKGRRDRIQEELAAAGLLGPGAAPSRGVGVHALAVPGLDEERHVVVIPSA
jgi:16S rRNA (guanine527-N7)-methyltransferase